MLLSIAIGALWVRSYWVADWSNYRLVNLPASLATEGVFISSSGVIFFGSDRPQLTEPKNEKNVFEYYVADQAAANELISILNRHGPDFFRFQFHVMIRDWFLLLILMLPASTKIILFYRERLLKNPGQCRVCGYDLRATPARCQECGIVPAKKDAKLTHYPHRGVLTRKSEDDPPVAV